MYYNASSHHASSHQYSLPTNVQHIRYEGCSLVPNSGYNMSVKLSRVATSKYDELLLLLEEGTTQDIRHWWYSTKCFEDILVKGGYSRSNLSLSLSLLRSQSIYIYIYIYISGSLSIYIDLSLSLHLSILRSLSLSLSLFLCLSVSLSLSLEISLFLSLSLS